MTTDITTTVCCITVAAVFVAIIFLLAIWRSKQDMKNIDCFNEESNGSSEEK